MNQRSRDDFGPGEPPNAGMSARFALRAEYAIIALGIFALALIFQPFSLSLFGIGCGLVVVAGLVNNLLPLCRPGVRPRALVRAGIIVAFIFCVILLVSLTAAYLYGRYFVIAMTTDESVPFYEQPFVWAIGAIAFLLGAAVLLLRPPAPDPLELRR